MSELTPCNYCSYQRIKKRADDDGLLVSLLPAHWGMGGTEVYVSPVDVDVEKMSEIERHKYYKAWFMSLPDHCCC